MTGQGQKRRREAVGQETPKAWLGFNRTNAVAFAYNNDSPLSR